MVNRAGLPLHSGCSSIITYDTGDIRTLSSQPCLCGRGLKLIKNLGGRNRDYIILSDGWHIHGAFYNHLNSIYEANWLIRYHIKQISSTNIIFQCLVNRTVTTYELNNIESEIEKS